MRARKTWHVSFAFYFILLCIMVVASEIKGQVGLLFTSDTQLSSSLVNQVYKDKNVILKVNLEKRKTTIA